MATAQTKVRPKPFLFPQLCKACGRCIDACPKHCIEFATEIDPQSGLTPIVVHEDVCNGCGLCFDACPEPYGLMPRTADFEGVDMVVSDPYTTFGARTHGAPQAEDIPDRPVPLPAVEPMVLKGNYAAAVGAMLAGCRHFFGYPITPSTEGAELMAKVLPEMHGVFVQAVSEVATVNMMYGCGGAGLRCMTFTSSPGFSLMLEGISYMVGAEVPGVFVNVMRGGPGLGNIGPEQADISLMCRGLGHGNTHAIVLAPSTPQEMLDLTMEAFALAFRYRNPVVIAGDGYLGQVSGRVTLPTHLVQPGIPAWAVYGDAMHRGNLITSIYIVEADLELHNEKLNRKFADMEAAEQRSACLECDDAEWLVIATNTPGRMAGGAVQQLRAEGVKAGLFRPITLWPFPVDALVPLLERARGIVVVEAGPGQLEDELRLALSKRGTMPPPIHAVRRHGGVLPSLAEIVERVRGLTEVSHG
ncbi:MAG: 3-methyl-2-oxobutanoate dehydrogenase subunit VorB [Gemmatimonadota bacterium]|nr:3-methyl-2-oxobutanoate dehydrogenase subunit VorB [Gemmatimonadota bacterium]MDH5199004.1 3-methyl-2-oxobutanoate dehydrogenase subunit VorB [Gemmatimonadota bacterium]